MFGVLWFSGVCVCTVLIVARRIACSVVLQRSRLDVDAELESQCRRVAERLGIRRRVRLLVTSRSVGPAVFGVFRPVIVLPKRVLDGRGSDQVETILAHELLHLRRGDTLVGLLQVMVQAVWWFHPLVWWANRQIVRERERCCDDEVVSSLRCEPSDYAQTLLDVLKSTRRVPAIPGVPGIRRVELTTRRLEHIMTGGRRHYRNPKLHWLLLFVRVAVFVPGAALTFSGDDKADEPQPIRLHLDADGKVLVLGRKVGPDQLKPILRQLLKLATDGDTKPAVSIQADEEAKHESLVKLVDLCSEPGVTNVRFSVVRSRQAHDKTDATAKNDPGTPRDPKWTGADARALRSSREFVGHTNKANAVAWSSDGKLIASGGSDAAVRLWDAATGKQLASMKCDGRQVWSVAMSPDNRLVVAGCDNGSVRIGNVQSHEPVASIKASEHEVWSVSFSPDSRHVASGTKDGKVQVWDAATGKEKFSASNSSQVSGIRFTPDGSMLATSSVNQPVKLWDAESGEVVRPFNKAPTFQQWVAVSPNGQLIATASWDGSSLLWDAKTGKLLKTFAGPPAAARRTRVFRSCETFLVRPGQTHLNYVTFSPDGQLCRPVTDRGSQQQ